MKIINRLIHNLWITYSQYQHLVCVQRFANFDFLWIFRVFFFKEKA